MSNSLCYTPDSFGSGKNVSETLFSSTCGLCWVSGPFRCGRLWKCLFPLWTGLAHVIKVSHIHLLQPLSAEACKAQVPGSILWVMLPVFRSATLQATIKYVPHALDSFQKENPKSRKSGFSSCNLWVHLDCREVKMILAWNSKSKPFSSCFGSDAKLPKSF